MRALIEAAGARLVYLPPYRPDVNPIELAWSKLKGHLRKSAARTTEALYSAITEGLQTLSPGNARAGSLTAATRANSYEERSNVHPFDSRASWRFIIVALAFIHKENALARLRQVL